MCGSVAQLKSFDYCSGAALVDNVTLNCGHAYFRSTLLNYYWRKNKLQSNNGCHDDDDDNNNNNNNNNIQQYLLLLLLLFTNKR